MRIAIIGGGYVGLVTAACFAELGNRVTCIDTDPEKIRLLRQGASPIYEPGLEETLNRNAQAGRLSFTSEVSEAVREAETIFLAVGTPPAENGLPNLTYLHQALADIAPHVNGEALVVIKSTVPPGTTREVKQKLEALKPGVRVHVASNPEFLRQGAAIKDFMQPDRIVAGVECEKATELLKRLYAPITDTGAPLFLTGYESAEMIKYAANSLLAVKVAFINEMADICEKLGANVREVAKGIGSDKRIGPAFLQAGPGIGGSCFPKDTLALSAIAQDASAPSLITEAVLKSNDRRKRGMVGKIVQACGGGVKGKTLAVLGLTFKPGTDDMREAPSLVIVPGLLAQGARIRAYDPQGMEEAKKYFPGGIDYCADAYDACKDAAAVIILTEWDEFKGLDVARLHGELAAPLCIDLRNIYKRSPMLEAGFTYHSIGRASVAPKQGLPKDLKQSVIARSVSDEAINASTRGDMDGRASLAMTGRKQP